MAIISVSHLTFSWPDQTENVFEDLSFNIDSEWKTGLIGRNGRGKTTLLRLLADREALDYAGTIRSPKGFKYFPLAVPDGRKRVGEVLREIFPGAESWKLERELSQMSLPEDVSERLFDNLSSGQKVRILLAALFAGDEDHVLLDEPTSHLDRKGQEIVAEYLKSKNGFIVASHDRSFLDSLCDHVLSLNRTSVEIVGGNYSVWEAEKSARDERNVMANEKLRREVGRLEKAARTSAEWSRKAEKAKFGGGPVDRGFVGRKAAKVMKRAKSLEKRQTAAVEQKKGLLADLDEAGSLKLATLRHRSTTLLEAKELEIPWLPGKKLDLSIKQGDRIVLLGDNGAGKSSFLKALAGKSDISGGRLWQASGLKVSYLPQESGELDDAPGTVKDYAAAMGLDLTMFLTVLRNLGAPRGAFETDLAALSAGQKRKTLLASSLCQPSHLYVWDEPLNYLDVISRRQLEELLLAWRPALIFAEHEELFVGRIATEKIIIP